MVNRLKTLSKEFREILRVTSQEAESLGFSIYLVGGVVRDLLLDKKIFDLDIVVEGKAHRLAQKVAGRLEGFCRRHQAFGTATVEMPDKKIDFATARTEKYSHSGALPKVSPASLEDDLFRRDFTINAMAISLNKKDYGRLIDIYCGFKDLKSGVIRVLHDKSFTDDPTRILRALRFEQRFSFSLAPHTLGLMKKALQREALKAVSSHRLRDEIILILKEPRPYRYIKRIDKVLGLGFLSKTIKLKKEDFSFFLRLERITSHYLRKHKKHRPPQIWIAYLAAIVGHLPADDLEKFLHDFAFRRGERLIIHSIKNNLKDIRKINAPLKPSQIYARLSDLSFEALLFFYAYYPLPRLRKNIDAFLNDYLSVQIRVTGEDLKGIGLKPQRLYSSLFQELLYRKLDKGFKNKNQELEEIKAILKSVK
jgi:tRNA nucleotidyltransferase (CCA-adding enzyme)